MLLVETAIFYLLLGGAVAVAVFIRGRTTPGHTLGLHVAAACLFWPLFLPVLLAQPSADDVNGDTKTQSSRSDRDAMAAAISQVETELDAALEGLDGWAENVLNS